MSNDRSYLGVLQDYYTRHRTLPSYASIGGLLGLRSKSSVAPFMPAPTWYTTSTPWTARSMAAGSPRSP